MKLAFIVHDHDKPVNDFPLGVAYLVATLRERGFPEEDIHVLNMDVYHHSDQQLYDYLERGEFDLVGIGMIAGYWQYRQLKRIFAALDRLKRRPQVVLGGYMFTPEPEYFMRRFKADFVVLGEGETPFSLLIEALAEGRPVEDIPSLAYWSDGEVRANDRCPPIKDLDSIPLPAWDKFPVENYVPKVRVPVAGGQRSMPVLTSRGCLYHCAFCYRMEPGYRTRSVEGVMEEVKRLVTDYYVNAICFRDELLMSTPGRAMELAEAILREGLKIHFDIDGRLNAARPDALKLLKQAGCVYVNYGVESLDQNVLNNMNKKQTVDEIIRGVEMTRDAGLHSGLNVIYGNVGDNRETAQKTVDFLKKYNTYGEMRTLKPVTPYPGSPLYYLALEKGYIKDCQDFYENKHLNSDLLTCNFTELPDEELYQVLWEANQELIRDHFDQVMDKHFEAHRKLYFEGDTDFRGVRI